MAGKVQMTQPKFLGVIPARYASSRLPGKPLLEIGGKTMLEHVYRRALASGVFFRVVIATDDHRIYDAAEKIGADVLMTRADHPDGSSRVAEIAAKIDTDYVINIQGDEPMLDPRMLRELAAGLTADAGADSATVCVPITRDEDFNNPNIVKVVRAATDARSTSAARRYRIRATMQAAPSGSISAFTPSPSSSCSSSWRYRRRR